MHLMNKHLKIMMIVQFMIAVAVLTLVAGGLDDDDEKKFVVVKDGQVHFQHEK